MKKLLTVLVAACLIVVFACAEETTPKYITAQEGEPYAIQIRSLEGDKSVGIHGIESEPVARSFADFRDVFIGFIRKNWEAEAAFSEAVWSDGAFVHICDMGDVVLRVYTAGAQDDAQFIRAQVTDGTPDDAFDVQVVAGAAFWAAAQYSEAGKMVMQIVFIEDHSEDWFADEPSTIWSENGYALTYGRTATGMAYGDIVFSEEIPVKGGYLSLDEEEDGDIHSGLTVPLFLQRMQSLIDEGPFSGQIAVPELPKEKKQDSAGEHYEIIWDDCGLNLYTAKGSDLVTGAALYSLSRDTVSMCMHTFYVYLAAAGQDAESLLLMPALVGGSGTWPEMTKLNPYCVMNGVALQCTEENMLFMKVPKAIIYGATPAED